MRTPARCRPRTTGRCSPTSRFRPAAPARPRTASCIDALASQDHTGFNPDNVRPTVDLSANEPEPQFGDEAWPTKIPTLVSLESPDGLQQSLNLATGQFFTGTSGGTTGTERLWTHIGGRVTYSSSLDFTPPTIDSIDAFLTGQNTVSFTGHFSDLDQNDSQGTVTFAQVVYDLEDEPATGMPCSSCGIPPPAHGRAERRSPPTTSSSSSRRATRPATAVTARTRAVTSTPCRCLSTSGTLTLTPSGSAGSAPWYTGAVTVTPTSSTGADVTVSVDGGPYVTPRPAESRSAVTART